MLYHIPSPLELETLRNKDWKKEERAKEISAMWTNSAQLEPS